MSQERLFAACAVGDLKVVKAIIANNCARYGRYYYQCDRDRNGNTLLHLACTNGHVDIVKYLLQDKSSCIIIRAKNGSTPLHCACSASERDWTKLSIVKLLVNVSNHSATLDSEDGKGRTPLHVACLAHHTDIIKYLVQEKGCCVDVKASDGSTPLHVACMAGYTDIARYLILKKSCNVNCQSSDGSTPLHYACTNRNLDIIRLLLIEKNCETNIQNKKGQTPLTIPLSTNGDLLVHVACQRGAIDILRYLLCDLRCNPEVRNKEGQTPLTIPLNSNGNHFLHVACQWGDIDILEYLLCDRRCDTGVRNKKGQTPLAIPLNDNGDCLLHVVCQQRHAGYNIVKYLACNQLGDMNVRNNKGNSPLHVACQVGDLLIIKRLTCANCDMNAQNEDGDTPLHVACQLGHMDIVTYLTCQKDCKAKLLNKNGDSPLHVACRGVNLDIVKHLVTENHCEKDIICNNDGDSLLHKACEGGSLAIAMYLVHELQCDLNAQNIHGNSPLLKACQLGHANIVKFLTTKQCNTNVQNENGDSPLHMACQGGNADIVKYLLDGQCDVNVQNKNKESPLHVAIKSSEASISLCLLQHEKCSPILLDAEGNTPLHLACMTTCTNADMLQVAKSLLSSTDPSCVNNAGQTPVQLTRNYQLIQHISQITESKTKHSIQTYIKFFFLGNPSTGKSTLVKAICSETPLWQRYFPHFIRRVRNIPRQTAGIIPITFHSKTFGNTVLYDMAGQYEYYSSHSTIIKHTVLSSPSAFVVVVDLSMNSDEIARNLKYWWSFIYSHAAQSTSPSHVILVGSHADKLSASDVRRKISILSSAFQGSSPLYYAGSVPLDCRDPVSVELAQFCSLVDHSCSKLRQVADIDLRCHILYSFLLEKFEGKVACTLSDIASQAQATDTLLPKSPEELVHLVSSLSDKGLVVLLKDNTSINNSWVILQKEFLLKEINGTLFAPEDFKEYVQLAMSTGVVPLSRIKARFTEHDPSMIVGFLTHLEFCFKINEHQTVQMIEGEDTKDKQALDIVESDEYYFFPSLVRVKMPCKVWERNKALQYTCGWYYKCTNPDRFLTTHFLHVLILRLAFSIVLRPTIYKKTPVLCRRCSVWKHGIGWCQDDIEVVVEVDLQWQRIIVMLRCSPKKIVKCIQLRSEVIQKVKQAKVSLCEHVKMAEFLIHPFHVIFPFKRNQSLYSLTDIANAIAKKETHVVDQKGDESIPVSDLVLFEPYRNVTPELLNELFSPDKSDKLVSKYFLAHLASCVYPEMSLFEEVIDPQPVTAYQKELEKESHPASKCLVLFKWLRKMNPTYENFHTELDKFSIFGGSNPMVSENHPRTVHVTTVTFLCRT